jgi:hypothetical protein
MTPAEVIRTLRSEGVTLTIEDARELKVAGKGEVVKRWLTEIRAHKPGIIEALSSGTEPVILMTPMEEAKIRRWLAQIEEHDTELVAYTIKRCRTNQESREFFLRRSMEVPPVVATGVPAKPSCVTCIHRRGRHDTYFGCVAREDLPPLYGPGHPLRQLPDDGGSSCISFAASPTRH